MLRVYVELNSPKILIIPQNRFSGYPFLPH